MSRWDRIGRAFTGLTVRILAVNVAPILILVIGILYLGQYKESLIRAELETMKAQAQLFAGAIAEGAVRPVSSTEALIFRDPAEMEDLSPELSRRMIRRLAETTESRTRLFDKEGTLVGDSHQLIGPGGVVQIIALDPPNKTLSLKDVYRGAMAWVIEKYPMQLNLPVFPYTASGRAQAYPDSKIALEGNISASAWNTPDGEIVLFAAAPVQKVKQVLGVILLTRDGRSIEETLANVRGDVLRVFFGAFAITILLSLYLSRVIERPLKKLAVAAETVRLGKGRDMEIPDLSHRRDEIGELSLALREMTQALWARMDTIERFAADVSHEIKNPLTSLRSAVETATLIKDPEKRDKLMDIVMHDVQRLDRLISDISGASRLDAELSRDEFGQVDLRDFLLQLLDFYRKPLERAEAPEGATNVEIEKSNLHLDLPRGGEAVYVSGNQVRLAQVFRNLISNALSFSPPKGHVTIRVIPKKHYVTVEVEDQGPGIPENKLETVFDRFYTERPEHEDFGGHSGLGLSICRQIIEAHGGEIFARNVLNEKGEVTGAKFTVILGTS